MTTQDTEKLLAERRKTHGEFHDHAAVTQALMAVLEASPNWPHLPAIVREALHMDCHKTGRIVTGNPWLHDHWLDKQGYCGLVVQRTVDGVGLRERSEFPEGPHPSVAPPEPSVREVLVQTGAKIFSYEVDVRNHPSLYAITPEHLLTIPTSTRISPQLDTIFAELDSPGRAPRPTPENGSHHAGQLYRRTSDGCAVRFDQLPEDDQVRAMAGGLGLGTEATPRRDPPVPRPLPPSLAVVPNKQPSEQTLEELRDEEAYWRASVENSEGWGAGLGVATEFLADVRRWIVRREAEESAATTDHHARAALGE